MMRYNNNESWNAIHKWFFFMNSTEFTHSNICTNKYWNTRLPFFDVRYWKRNINDLLIIITHINLFEAFAQSLKFLTFFSVNYTHFRSDLMHTLTLHFKSDFM